MSLGLCLPAAKGTDVERLGHQRRLQRRLVQLGVVSQGDDCAIPIGLEPRQRTVWPLLDHIDGWETFVSSEGAPWIDDADLITG